MDQDNKQPATVDYYNRVEVVQHFRDLLNMADLLDRGLDAEVASFRGLLGEHGWDSKAIQVAYEDAAKFTVWESQIPRAIKDGNSE